MRRSAISISLAIGAGVAGCAAPPHPDPDYARTSADVQLSAASLETGESATLPAEPELAGAHPVDYYVLIALERNPEILAARQEVAAHAQVIPQVTALDDPMLVETFQPIDDHSLQTAAGRGPSNLMLSQKFPWFGKLRLRGEVAEQETRMALARLARAQLDVIEKVKLAYYELYFTQRAIEVAQEDRDLLDEILESIRARYQTGQVPLEDLLRVEIELRRVDDRLVVLRRQLRQAQADLAKILHTSPQAELAAQSDIDVPSAPAEIDRLYEAAVRCRPELQERLTAIVRAQRAGELARLRYFPDVTAGVGWQAMTTDEALSRIANGNDNFAFTVGVNLPIWRDKLQAGVREAEHRAMQSARRYDAERDDTFRIIRRLSVQAAALEEQVRLFREPESGIIPNQERTLRLLLQKYSVGESDFQDVIDNFSRLLAFDIQLARLEANLGQTLASLERAVGCQLATLPEVVDEQPENDTPDEMPPQ